MRKLALILGLFLAFCGTAKAQVPVSQACINTPVQSGTTFTCVFPSTVVQGQLMAFQVSWFNTAATITVSDTCASTWVIKQPIVSTNWYGGYFYTLSAGASCGATETVTVIASTGVTGDAQITGAAFTVAGATLDCQPSTIGTGSGTAVASNTCSVSGSYDLLVGFASTSTFTTWTPGGNGQGGTYSRLVGEDSAYLGTMAYMTVTSPLSYSVSFSASSANWVSHMFAFNISSSLTNPVNSCVDNSNATSAKCILYGVGAHHRIIVPQWGYKFLPAVPSDTLGLTWTQGTSCNAFRAGIGNDFLTYAYADTGSSSGIDTITVSVTSGGTAAMEALEYINLAVVAPDAEVCATGTTGSITTISSGNFTPTHNGDIILGIGESVSTTLSPGSGFTIFSGVPVYSGGSVGPFVIEAKTQSVAAAIAATEVQTGANGFYIMLGTSFQVAATGRRRGSVIN